MLLVYYLLSLTLLLKTETGLSESGCNTDQSVEFSVVFITTFSSKQCTDSKQLSTVCVCVFV